MQNKFPKKKDKIVISMGDPAGIGIEVTLKALGSKSLPKGMQPILVGDQKLIEFVYKNLKSQGVSQLANPKHLDIINIPIEGIVQPGKPNAETGDASFKWLKYATNILKKRQARAIVTAPIAKHAWHEAGHTYPGQTELLAELTNTDQVSMLFTAVSAKNNWRLNTLLATTHIPLSEVPTKLTPSLITFKLDTLLEFCKRFHDHPRLAIAGLNPHSGEKGQLGKEEIEWLIPVINEWQAKHPNIYLEGPIPPDTCWLRAANAWNVKPIEQTPDGFLALYHDQGLIPVKLIAFDAAVNTTLGMPFIRTSPDHGTGFDIAGKGCANSQSMLAALKAAWELTEGDN